MEALKLLHINAALIIRHLRKQREPPSFFLRFLSSFLGHSPLTKSFPLFFHLSYAGDFVYLQPSDPAVPLYIARVDDLVISNDVPSATITWFYRPQELNLDTPLPVFDNEVFAADESETHPLDSVAGKCLVVPPGSPIPAGAAAAGSEAGGGGGGALGGGPQRGPMDVYVCSRKYISTEG